MSQEFYMNLGEKTLLPTESDMILILEGSFSNVSSQKITVKPLHSRNEKKKLSTCFPVEGNSKCFFHGRIQSSPFYVRCLL